MQVSHTLYNTITEPVQKRHIELAHAQERLKSQIKQKKTELLFAHEKCIQLTTLLEIYKKNTAALEQIRSLQESKIISLKTALLDMEKQSLD